MGGEWVLTLALGESKSSFNMEKAVCNHGFFMMAPNRWSPSAKTLQRPLRLADGASSVTVSISHSPLHSHLLYIRVLLQSPSKALSLSDSNAILEQVGRMLRITKRDERDVREFQKVHPQAKERGFGRVFRSPSLFEDAVKSILLCNCSWARTLKMAEALCKLQFEVTENHVHPIKKTTTSTSNKGLKRKRAKTKATDDDDSQIMGNFPNAREIASLDKSYFLEKYTPILGYRAKHILSLAKDFESGKLNGLEVAEKAEEEALHHEEMILIMKKIRGFGPFVCANVLMCIRIYENVPADSETIRHLQQVHGRKNCNKKTILKEVKEIYDKYAPFQCLAYWMELLEYYEDKFGKLSELPESSYKTISGSRLKFDH
ncbi:DNA glycosylase [Parasponia andersonii]|uniref:DNA glycosylase n=1 Tax=Parasponia andersonii TaxID=3476 RepID=A0A2P5ACW8_PARAD|nr:DNA glycosylase [Parasponia andersonii]